MNRLFCLILAAIAALSAGCTETPVSAPLRSLEGSQDVSFVCLGPGGVGRQLRECPDYDGSGDHLHALVTQEKGEVAVIDHWDGIVVDADPSTPGFTFLHIGGDPRDIVSTPGGTATFVGVAEVNREGIFALPSTCIGPPRAGQSGRDLTTWPACSLPAAPGSMAILIDPLDSAGNERDRCPGMEARTPREGALTAGRECPADLTTEPGPIAGRRKLAVALPELGRIDIFDAQAILNRDPGSFDPCDWDLEARVPLRVDLPTNAVRQRLPPDLQAPGCVPPEISHAPRTGPFQPQPSGFALGGGDLYVGDRQAPVIHVLDVDDPCAVTESPLPLLPVSYNDPNRLVTTSELALSDPTSSGQQFLYALDFNDPDGSSAMVFNVTPGEIDRVPLVRPGTDRLPEPPDRIRFAGTVITSLAFGSRDLTVVDEEGRSANPFCNPDPLVLPPDPGALYRPTPDRSDGAAPGKLRGIFAFAALKSGEVMVIDVEDYDAACRRPTEANTSSTEDFRGCKNDPAVPDGMFVSKGTATVTDEVSCRVVQPHLARSASFVLTDDNGVRAPSLRALPRITVPGEGDAEPDTFPKLLATEYPAASRTETVPAEVYVGTEKFTTRGAETDTNRVVIDPTEAEENSLILPWVEPRSYAPADEQTLVYEGMFSHRSGPGVTGEITNDGKFRDRNNAFCGSGVQDMARAREWGQELGLTRDQDLDRFASEHADIVEITANIPAREDTYWQSPDGAACVDGQGYVGCLNEFGQGSPDAPVLSPCPTALSPNLNRELIVREAYQSELVVEPANGDPGLIDRMDCCFPSFVSYRIRAAKQWVYTRQGFRFPHDIVAQRQMNESRLRCVKDCRPQRRWQKGRAIEIPLGSWSPDEEQCSTGSCPACLPNAMGTKGTVLPVDGDPRSKCIFETLGARFVVYEGSEPSARDMCFSWVTNGGFTPLAARLTTQTLSVSPVNMTFVPEIGQLAVVDGSAAGLVFVSLDSIGVSRLFF
jgi:hypothetical protein